MEQLPLDFSQPPNRLTAIADVERKKNIVKNDYNQQGKPYSSTNPDALADGDAMGRGTGVFLDVYNQSVGTSVDVVERKNEIKINKYQPNKPYNVRGEV
jgi:hypothetical protein